MMSRVHFAPANAIFPSTPSTPSPTHSMSSLPSLPTPLTPPPTKLPPMFPIRPLSEPKISSPAPETLAGLGEMHIHFLLAFNPYDDPPIYYDVSLPPSSLNHDIPPEELAEPATHPPLSSLHVICPHLQWAITILPSPGSGGFVTVLDVFDCIYCILRIPVHPTEYGKLPSPDATLDVNAAYYRRCMRIGDLESRQLEESKGVKRVDFLMGRNRFMGLSGTLKGPDIWELNVR